MVPSQFSDLRAAVVINARSEAVPVTTPIAEWVGGFQDFGDEHRQVRIAFSLWNANQHSIITMMDIELRGTVYSKLA